MKRYVLGIAAVAALAAVGQVRAQAPSPWTSQPQLAARPDIGSYPLNAATPDDAYKQGLINRWEYERLEGPLPQAFQGPSANGARGGTEPR